MKQKYVHATGFTSCWHSCLEVQFLQMEKKIHKYNLSAGIVAHALQFLLVKKRK